MKIFRVTLLMVFFSMSVVAQSVYVRLITNKGNITLRLYDETPKHRDMFLQSIKKGIYTDALFNRVIKSFVSQGGELDDSILNREKRHPEVPGKRLAAEIKSGLYHKKGALGAGRDDNKEKSSYYNQIYLVNGKPQTDAQLDVIEQKKGFKYTAKQREVYKTVGGIPRLDQDYTIFGEIVEGMDVADQINSVTTDKNDVPLSPVVFKAVILSKKEVEGLKLNP